MDIDAVRCLCLRHEGIWHLLVLCHTRHATYRSHRVDRVRHQSSQLLRWRANLIYDFFMLQWHCCCCRLGPSLDLKELVELSVHDFDCFVSAIYDSLEQLPSLYDWDLGLLLLCETQTLEGSIEVVLNFWVNLRHDVLFFLSDDFNKFKALFSLQLLRLRILFNVKFGFIPFVFPAPQIVLNHFVIIWLLLTSLFHLHLRLVQATFVDF